MNAFTQKAKALFAFENYSEYSKTVKEVKKAISDATKNGRLNVYVKVSLAQADPIRDYFMQRFFFVDLPLRYYDQGFAMLYISWK